MLISLIHPSRGRPEKAKSTYDFWMSRAKYPENIEHILSLDFSDTTHENYTIFGPNSRTIIDHNECVVEATNQGAAIAKGDILVYLSDDFKAPENWDEEIRRLLPLGDPFLLRVNDGYQPMDNDVLTIPIMNRELFLLLGYFFNPLYRSMWVDCDLFNVCRDVIITAPDLVFLHEHPVTGKCATDQTYERSNANFETGREIYNKRAVENNWKPAFKIMPI